MYSQGVTLYFISTDEENAEQPQLHFRWWEKITEFSKFGDTGVYDVTSGVINDARTLMAALYWKPPVSSLNTLTEHIFANNKSDIQSLPPTEDAFGFHLLRALYQLVSTNMQSTSMCTSLVLLNLDDRSKTTASSLC